MGRIKKAIEEYSKIKNKSVGCFWVEDYTELIELSGDKYELISNSLKAGFIIGYRAGQRKIKKGV